MTITEPLLTADELASLLGISTESVYDLNSSGTGPPRVRVGRRIRYSPADVSAWLDARRVA